MSPQVRPERLDLSIVVVVYDMAREAPRTLHSLSAAYQRQIDPATYEVIVVDNGSTPPLNPEIVAGLSGNFRLLRIERASPSPAPALNLGLAEARGDVIGVMIDGARIATPGLLHFGRRGVLLYDRAVVAALGWYLGADLQGWAMRAGYDEPREDALLASIGWPQDGYRLFEVATLDESSADVGLAPPAESNALFMRRDLWDELGGVEERFDSPGGGFLNLDTLARARELPGTELVILLGEATMHQVHGGIATNAPIEAYADNQARWSKQYEEIRGHPFVVPRSDNRPIILGAVPHEVLLRLTRVAAERAVETGEPPPGSSDPASSAGAATDAPPDPVIAALVALAEGEFRQNRYHAAVAVSRLIRERAPEQPEALRLLSLIGRWPAAGADAATHLAMAKAHRLLGQDGLAEQRRPLADDG